MRFREMQVRCMECLAIFVKSDFLHFVGGFPLGKSGAESNAPNTWYGVLTNALHLVSSRIEQGLCQ